MVYTWETTLNSGSHNSTVLSVPNSVTLYGVLFERDSVKNISNALSGLNMLSRDGVLLSI